MAVWWSGGRRRLGVIGRYPALSLRQARDLFAEQWRPEIEAGRDPRRAKRAAAAAGSVEQLFAEYVAAMKAQGRRTWAQVERALLTADKPAAAALGRDTRAADVTAEHVAEYLAEVYQRGSRTAADRYRSYLHAAFRWGMRSTHDYTRAGEDGPRTTFALAVNPVSAVPRDNGATKPRDRALSAEEVRALWAAADGKGFSLSTGPVVRLLLCTGQRVTDVLRAEGCDFDLDAALWTIPSAKRKVDAGDHLVPLPAQALPILSMLISVRGQGLLFPHADKPGEHVPDQTVNRAIARWTAATEGARLQARDLRRTWKTLAGEAGISKEIRDRIQGHALTDVSAVHYDRWGYLPEKRQAMIRWSAFLERAISGRAARESRQPAKVARVKAV
jgi:integrase